MTADKSQTDINPHQIWADALDLKERIVLYRSSPERFTVNENISIQRLEKWKFNLGLGSDSSLESRIKRLGITEDDLPCLLGDIAASSSDQEPAWWTYCKEVMETPPNPESWTGFLIPMKTKRTSSESDQKDNSDVPFEHAFGAWIEVATNRLVKNYPSARDILGEKILRKEQRALLGNLSGICRSVMLSDFNTLKARRYSTNDAFLGIISDKPPAEQYSKYVEFITQSRWAGYIAQYPAMVRLMGLRIDLWCNSLGEFIDRLEADLDAIHSTFSTDPRPLGRLISGGRGLSDSHNGGRAVMICTFENGTKVVYKPRSMSIDSTWQQIMKWWNSNSPDRLSMSQLKILDRGIYGWMEFVEHAACESADEVVQYFEKMGVLLLWVHALQGNDFHLENVVARATDPIPIDLETISVPRPLSETDSNTVGHSRVAEMMEHSVLRTLLLPNAMSRGQAGAKNLGAVEIVVDHDIATQRKKLVEINTDFMKWVPSTDEDEEEDTVKNQVQLKDGTKVIAQDYMDDLSHGYESAYQLLMEKRESFLKDRMLLDQFDESWVRVLNRSTNIYFRLLAETVQKTVLKSGVDRWIASERLLVGVNTGDPKIRDTMESLCDAEQRSLLVGDIAYFTTKANDTSYSTIDIYSGNPQQVEQTVMDSSASDQARNQILSMDEENLAFQKFLIKSSYVGAIVSLEQRIHETLSPDSNKSEPMKDSEYDESFITEVGRKKLDEIIDDSITVDGLTTWIEIIPDPVTETAMTAPMSTNLYGGNTAVGICLEKAGRYLNDSRYLNTARNIFEANAKVIKNNLEKSTKVNIQPDGLGNTAGIIQSLRFLSRFDTELQPVDMLDQVLNRMDKRSIARDVSYDIIAGTAGFILNLESIRTEIELPIIDQLIEHLAEHLVKSVLDRDGISWDTMQNQNHMFGFSHGSAGICLALLKAWKISGRDEFKDLALLAVEFESSYRSEKHLNWPDTRNALLHDLRSKDFYMHAWCHGLPGITLGRAAMINEFEHPIIREDLEFGISVLKNREEFSDSRAHLCCGWTGIAEIMKVSGQLAGDSELVDKGNKLVMNGMNDIMHSESDNPGDFLGHNLFQGKASIPYLAIRTIYDPEGPSSLLCQF